MSQAWRAVALGVLGCAAASLAAVVRQPQVTGRVTEPLVRAIPSPAGSQLAGQMTVSPRGVPLSWVEQDRPRASLKFAERTPDGWTSPSRRHPATTGSSTRQTSRPCSGSTATCSSPTGSSRVLGHIRLRPSAVAIRRHGRTWTPSVTPHHDGFAARAWLRHAPANAGTRPRLDLARWSPHRRNRGSRAAPGAAMGLRYATFDRVWKQTSEDAGADRRPQLFVRFLPRFAFR
jgi:hypothetical protein